MNKIIKSYWIENTIILIFFILTISEALGKLVWQGTGVRHLYLLFVVFLAVSVGKRGIAFDKRSIRLLMLSIVFFFALCLFSGSLTFGSFLGWSFTYFFFILFVPLSTVLNVKFDHRYAIKRIVLLIFLLSLYPFLNSLINFPSFRSSYGLFRDQSGHSSMLCIGAVLSNYLWLVTNNRKWKYLILFFVMAVLLTFMKKSIGFMGIWLVFSFLPKATVKFRITFGLVLSLILFLVLPIIINNVNSVLDYESNSLAKEHVRWGMYIGAFSLATTNFPFGSGFSSFGSLFSVYDYSSGTYRLTQTYYDLGLNNLADNEIKLRTGNTTFLDTYYPHIYGEGGIIQLVLVFVLIVHILKVLKRKCIRISDLNVHNTFLWIVLMVFIDGITINSPEMPVFIFFYSVLPGLIIASKEILYLNED